tara:strand:- start:662 stop:952 length:291 start_codon:yes stop_codon:yes gene_type:complete
MSTKELESKIAELEKRVEEIEGNAGIIESHNDALMQLVRQIIPNINTTMNMMRKEYIETFENLDGYLIANIAMDNGVLWRLPGTSWPRFDDEGNEL